MKRSLLLLAISAPLLAVAACGGSTSSRPGDRVQLDTIDPGDECADGGVAITVGADTDGDDALTGDEVRERRVVCHGASDDGAPPGLHAPLVDTRPLGEDDPRCPNGGLELRTGTDANDDGTLDDAELDHTEVVCNGQDGGEGASLVSVLEEAPGERCQSGGQAIRTGTDANGDGALQPTEVTTTTWVCHGTDGDATLVRQRDATPTECPDGGLALLTGPDSDHDAYLDDGEVTATSPVCQPAGGAPSHASLYALAHRPPDADCPTGAQILNTGLDLDDDGSLDSNEITATATLCDPANLITRLDNAVYGGACPRGGVRLDSGHDLDANGTLDDAEVERSDYLCNRSLVQFSAGGHHACAVISDGTVRCWGDNGDGEVGLPNNVFETPRPTTVSGLEGVAAVDAGFVHTCAVRTNGTLACWGSNASGQLGVPVSPAHHEPVDVSALRGVVQVVAGIDSTCALLQDHTVRCWGDNRYGQLGVPRVSGSPNPLQVPGLTDVAELASGNFHVCARRTSGLVACWGLNTFGQLGDGTTIDHTAPANTAPMGSAAVSLTAGGDHTCALLDDQSLRCWGHNNAGQLGIGAVLSQSSPSTVPLRWAAVSGGDAHTCGISLTGRLICWGRNLEGQLGDGTTDSNPSPTSRVAHFEDATATDAGLEFTCATHLDGTLACWGSNDHGRLGNGTAELAQPDQSNVPVPVLWSDGL